MKKTLLIAAAALAASVISSQAQVYSQNIVGYVNSKITGNNSLTLINNPLLEVNGAVTNDAEAVLTSMIGGEVLYVWNGASFYQYIYAGPGAGTGSGQPSDFYDANGGVAGAIPGDGPFDSDNGVYWTQPPKIKQGQSVFIQNPNVPTTNTFVGTVVLSNTNAGAATPIAGNNAISYVTPVIPVGGNIAGTNFNLPFVGGEVVYVWNGSSYYQYIYAGPGAGTGSGQPSDFYDANGGGAGSIPGDGPFDSDNGVYWTQPIVLSVGQGIAIQNPNTATNWTQNLVIP